MEEEGKEEDEDTDCAEGTGQEEEASTGSLVSSSSASASAPHRVPAPPPVERRRSQSNSAQPPPPAALPPSPPPPPDVGGASAAKAGAGEEMEGRREGEEAVRTLRGLRALRAQSQPGGAEPEPELCELRDRFDSRLGSALASLSATKAAQLDADIARLRSEHADALARAAAEGGFELPPLLVRAAGP